MTQQVFKTTRITRTVTMFPYGNGFRVKYTKTSNCKANSRLLAFHDEEYSTKAQAEKAFAEILEMTKGN